MSSRLLQVRFFAVLREQAGCSSVDFESTASDAAGLYAELQRSYPGLVFPAHLLKVSINERYAAMDTALAAGDRVVFIPPIAGG
jgi:molybdopterin converting factor small subunit